MARVVETLLKVKADKQSVQQTTKAVASIDDRLHLLATSAKEGAQAFDKTGKALREAFANSKAIDRTTQAQRDLNREVERGVAEVRRYDDAYNSVSKRVSVFGDVDTGLATTAGLVGTVGGGAAQPLVGGIQLAAEFGAVAEALPRTAVGLKEIATRARDSSPLLRGVGNVMGGDFAKGLSSGKAGLAAVGAAGLATGVALGAVALAVNDVTKAWQRQADVLRSSIEASASVERSLAEGLTTEQAEARVAEIERALEAEEAILQRRRAAYDALEDDIENNFGFASGIVEGAIRVFSPQEQQLSDSIRDAENSVNSLQAELSNLQSALDEGRTTANDMAEAQTQSVEEIAQAEQQLAVEREQAVAQLTSLIAREATAIENYDRQVAQLQQDREIRDRREQEDYLRSVAENNERVAEIRETSAVRIVATEIKAGQALAAANAKYSKSVATINQKFFADAIKSQQEYNKMRRRAQEDLQDSVFDAVLDNDILRLTQAQRQGEKEAQRRDEDFAQEQAERLAERDQRLAELKEENTLRLAEVKATLQAERQQITASLQARLAQEREAQAERDARRELQQERQAEDDALADQRRQDAHERELARIDEQQEATQAALDATAQSVNNLVTAAQRLNNATRNQQARVRGRTEQALDRVRNLFGVDSPNRDTSSSRSRGVGSSGGRVAQFSEGGVVPARQRVFAEFEGNRDYQEAVLPLRRDVLGNIASMISANMNGGQHISITVGDGVTVEQVRTAFRQYAGVHNQAVQSAQQGA